MSLTTALNIAQSALQATSRQTSVVSQNVAGARDPDYSRRIAVVSSTAPGARVVQIQRAANELLFRQNLVAVSSREAQSAVYSGMERLGVSVNGADKQPLFLAELDYGGVFNIEGVPEDQLHPFLMIECPRMMFPFVRRIISDVTRDGGFPPFNMDPVDFVALYRSELNRRGYSSSERR